MHVWRSFPCLSPLRPHPQDYRATEGGWMRLALKNVAGDAALTAVELGHRAATVVTRPTSGNGSASAGGQDDMVSEDDAALNGSRTWWAGAARRPACPACVQACMLQR